MSNRSAARGTAAASSMRLTLRTSNAVATSNASPSRCFLFCEGSRAARSARTAAATVSTPPISKAPPNQRRSPPITSTFQAARGSDGCQGFGTVLAAAGWTTAFLVSALASLVAGALVLLLLRDSPLGRPSPIPLGQALTKAAQNVRSSWAEPGTRLGFWLTFLTLFTPMMFGVMWGYPFLTVGQGPPPPQARIL